MDSVIYYPSNANSQIVAGARIARWLFENFPRKKGDDVHLHDGKSVRLWDYKKAFYKTAFNLYMVNVPKPMVADIAATEWLVKAAANVIWIQNDYSIWAPTPVTMGKSMMTCAFTYRVEKKINTFVWSTCRDRCEKFPETYRYVNWNALAYTSGNIISRKRIADRAFYYGAFREGRMEDFDRYFKDPDLWTLSAPKVAGTKFRERYGFTEDHLVGPIKIPEDLSLWQTTLYIEDRFSHKQFHSPANRFYEALSANMCILVDSRAVKTLEKAGYKVPEACIVMDNEDVRAKLRNAEKIMVGQREWCKDPATGECHQVALQKLVERLVEKEVRL